MRKEEKFINLTGMIIKDRYCILERIGSGGNGSVYLALDMELGCKWAVKLIGHGQKKEAHILKELNHPFLPRIIDYEETEEHSFLVMEYIEGENLESYLKHKNKKIDFDEVLKIVLSIASIMSYFHELTPAVIYGDMKPANLIKASNGEIYLVDLGSVVYGYNDKPLICYGTKGFAAPEQYMGRVTKASDVYAFGKTVLKILEYTGLKNRSFKLWRILTKCCRKQEKHRYRDMTEVLKSLKTIKPAEKFSGRILRGFVLGMATLFGLSVGVMEMSKMIEKNVMDYKEELTMVTDLYWKDEQYHKNGVISDSSCKKIDSLLKDIFKKVQEKDEQREILRMLAVNAEYMEKYRNAAFYYEQMLIYDSKYCEGYGMYGLFLLRLGLEAESRRLYEKYMEECEIEDKQQLHCEDTYYLEQWEGLLEESNGSDKNDEEIK